MIHAGRYYSNLSQDAVLAHFMSTEDGNETASMKKHWDPTKGSNEAVLFKPEEMDIYVNKLTLEAYIFHGKDVDYDAIERLEFNPKTYHVDVIMKNGTHIDLGVKIQWLIRPYFSKAEEINIVQTKNGESVNGAVFPLVNLGKKKV